MRSLKGSWLAVAAVIASAACGRSDAPDDVTVVQSAVNTTVVVTVVDGAGVPQVGMDVEARRNNGSAFAYAATNASGRATFVLTDNSYRFVVGELGIEFYSGAAGHCVTPGCTAATITITRVDVLAVDTGGAPLVGQTVWWQTPGGVENGYSDTGTDGHVRVPTPAGSYRFVLNVGGQEFTSGASGHCTVPGCSTATITVPVPVTVTVRDTTGAAKSGVTAYWRNTANEEGGWTVTNASGVAAILAPQGAQRFVVQLGAAEYTSGAAGHCVVPGCTSASITVPAPVTVTVTETGGAPMAAKPVVWVNAAGDTGGSTNTNASGVATLTPPLEAVRFRVAVDGTQFFSGPSVHCNQPGCTSATISVSQPTVVTVVDGAGAAISGRAVTPLSDEGITSANKTTNASGQATFRLPFAHWRFRATCTANSEQFFSGNAGHCFIPGGCLTAKIVMPCGFCANKTNGTTCNDSNPCTTGEACQNQRCTGGTLTSCAASDQCHDVGACSAETGTCSNPPKANGAPCSDGNGCTQTDSCQAGACVGANPVVCAAFDQCHDAGTCNPGTGACSNPAKTNGTSCNDGNACTQTDACQSGACTGSNPISCAAQDQCHVGGTCNPATGACSASQRAADGTACSDGNRCSTGDSCRAGTCLPGATNVCGTTQPNYVSVIDLGSAQGWSYATGINNSGVVVGTDGPPDGGIYQLGYPGSKGFRWSESEGQVYLPWPGPVSYAVDINDAGVMSVTASNAPWEMRPCRYDPAVDAQPVCHPSAGNAGGINAAGTLTGSSYYPDAFVRLFRLGTGPIEILPSASGPDGRAKGVAIADDGTVVGIQMVDGGWQGIRYSAAHGTEQMMNLLPAGSGWTTAVPSSIRPGQFVGWGYQTGGFGRAFRMQTAANGDVTSIVALPMPSTFAANAPNIMSASKANASGEIIGSVYDAIPYWPQAAFVHSDAVGSVDLNTLIDPQSGWTLQAGFAINDNHEVVGYGSHGGKYRAYKLKLPALGPCPLNNSCSTGVRDLLSGTCSYTVKPNGAACDDGNACTQGDVCTAGTCQGPTAFACAPPDTCHTAGTCNTAAAAAQPPSTQDLLGWWRMEGNGDDASGGGHPLTNEGAAATPGRFGQGMKFDGTACMTAPIWDEARMQGASGVTVMAWINPSEQLVCPTPGQGLTIAGRGWDYSQGIGCFAAGPAASLKEEVRVAGTVESAGGWGYPGGSGAALPNQWMHVAFTYDHANVITYVNGRLVSVRPRAGQFGNYDPTFAVGCMVSWYFSENQRIQQFKGTIDEVMLYRRALSPTEVGAYYTASDPCTHPVLADGTTCSDSNACTQTDTCQAGTCVGGSLKTCAASDQCHTPGVCNPVNGVCGPSPVKPDGATCDDSAPCTQSESCVTGACQDTNNFPTVLNLPVQDLGSLGLIQSFANDINSAGTVVGWSSTNDVWTSHAWVHSGGGPLVSLTEVGLGPPSSADTINDAGTIAGYHTVEGVRHPFRYTVATGFEDLGTYGDASNVLESGQWIRGARASDVNNAGQIVGYYTLGNAFQGFRYSDGVYEEIGSLAGGTTVAGAISDSGRVVGYSLTVAGAPNSAHAVIYDNAEVGIVDLNDLIDPLAGWRLTNASDINGDFIVGNGVHNGLDRTFRLRVSTGVVDEISGGWQFGPFATGVNAAGDVVGGGYRTPENAAISLWSAFVYTDLLGFKNLDDLIPHDFMWTWRVAQAINAAGEIVGWGYHTGQEGPRPFRMKLPSGQSASCQARNMCVGGDTDQVCLFSDGVVQKPDGTFVALFGYDSSSTSSITPTQNEVRLNGTLETDPRPAPPTLLAAGAHTGAYLPTFTEGQTVSWAINGETVSASASSPRLQPVTLPGGGFGVVIGGTFIPIQTSSNQAGVLTPIAEGMATVGSTTYAIFSYTNSNAGNVNVPYGTPQNVLANASGVITNPSPTPPSWFKPGTQRGAIVYPLTDQLTWTLGTQAATVCLPTQSPTCSQATQLTTATQAQGTGVWIGGTFVVLVPTPTYDFQGSIVATEDTSWGGQLPASFAVAADGAATVNVPIWVPPGRAGMQPAVALSYDSHHTTRWEGLGPGWRLQGMSQITRCSKNLARDGVSADADVLSDTFCLDGDMLIYQSGGDPAHGALDGAIYRTEHDRFAKIVRNLTSAGQNRPANDSFTVFLKDGRVAMYAAIVAGPQTSETYDGPSQLPITHSSAGTVSYAWSMSSIHDRNNNVITYSYNTIVNNDRDSHLSSGDEPCVEHHLDSISYGSQQVKFQYTPAVGNDIPLRRRMFVSGLCMETTLKMTGIQLLGPRPETGVTSPQLLKQYDLTVAPEGLTEVREKDSAGVSSGRMVGFKYENASPVPAVPSLTALPVTGPLPFQTPDTSPVGFPGPFFATGDINGDGFDDIVYLTNSPISLVAQLSNGGAPGQPAFAEPVPVLDYYPAYVALQVIDADMDGKADIFVSRKYIETFGNVGVLFMDTIYYHSVGYDAAAGRFVIEERGRWKSTQVTTPLIGDLSGDGLADMIIANGGWEYHQLIATPFPGGAPFPRGSLGISPLHVEPGRRRGEVREQAGDELPQCHGFRSQPSGRREG